MKPKYNLAGAMLIFSTIGIFVRFVNLPSALIACVRGIIGAAFLIGVLSIRRQKISLTAILNKLVWLLVSGAVIGFNWILLFEAYRYTTVAVATLCYYMAPIFVILLSPIVFRETLSPQKLVCVAAAVIGTVLISGVLQSGFGGSNASKGVLLGLSAAVLYSIAVILNKKLSDLPPYDKTILQLAVAAIVLVPYCFFFVPIQSISITPGSFFLLLVVGMVHTGIAYYLYFSSISALPAQTVALYSYIDPIGAVLLSALLLQEPLHATELLGSILILGAAWLCENTFRTPQKIGD